MPAVIYEKKGRTAYIIINRPQAMNSFNAEVWRLLNESWIEANRDPDVWSVIVTGAGGKSFSSGIDLKEQVQLLEKGDTITRPWPEVTPMTGLEMWKPVIAAIAGYCIGTGPELALTCDIRIAADNAVFSMTEPQLGRVPAMGCTQRLPRQVPFCNAMEILLTGDRIDAQEAYRIGLVNRVVPLADLMPTAEAYADRLNRNGPLATRAIKEAAYRAKELPLKDGIRFESIIAHEIRQTRDGQEGPRSFVEKRKPVFKGE